ncbi:hypothetical protein Hanom_Chr14g01252101 [Helianthus anomalus]
MSLMCSFSRRTISLNHLGLTWNNCKPSSTFSACLFRSVTLGWACFSLPMAFLCFPLGCFGLDCFLLGF